jgi:hypothetical protein
MNLARSAAALCRPLGIRSHGLRVSAVSAKSEMDFPGAVLRLTKSPVRLKPTPVGQRPLARAQAAASRPTPPWHPRPRGPVMAAPAARLYVTSFCDTTIRPEITGPRRPCGPVTARGVRHRQAEERAFPVPLNLEERGTASLPQAGALRLPGFPFDGDRARTERHPRTMRYS